MTRPSNSLSVVALTFLALVAAADRTALGQSEEGYAPAGDVAIHYRDLGDGRPLLLVNGGPGWSSDHMLPVAKRLAQEYRVILFDQRGTGRGNRRGTGPVRSRPSFLAPLEGVQLEKACAP